MLLVTNDFPPKVGGIQNYLYELWKRLPFDTHVITTKYPNAEEFDSQQNFSIERVSKVLLPNPILKKRIVDKALVMKTPVILFDPLLPLGQMIPSISKKTGIACVPILHGAEITVPGYFPLSKQLAKKSLLASSAVVAAGNYVAKIAEGIAETKLNKIIIPPGVDCQEFNPDGKEKSRENICNKYSIPKDKFIIGSISRVVPRKGFDKLIESMACPELEDVVLIIAGKGRDLDRLKKLAKKLGVYNKVRFVGKVPFDELKDIYKGCDVFSMLCRDRWKSLEAEGFGIVFIEASASGTPVIAGISGGSVDAVKDSKSGWLVEPTNIDEVREKILLYKNNPDLMKTHGKFGREFVKNNFDYPDLAQTFAQVVLGNF